jgi:hypothetical protein
MAIDSTQKRFSIMDFDIPTQPGMSPPSGSIDAATRLALLWLYSGIAASAAAATAGDDWLWRRRRRRSKL